MAGVGPRMLADSAGESAGKWPKMREVPCYKDGRDCPKRHPRCHGSCPEYAEYRAGVDADAERRRQEQDVRAVGADYRIRMKLNYLRKNRR